MLRIRIMTSCLLAGGLLTAAAQSASAQSFENAGVVRISDSVSTPAPIPANQPVPASASCPPGGGSAGYGYGYGHGGYRFSPPVKRPIYRSPVSYTKGFPDAWTGATTPGNMPGYRAPTVYMPTDTTQLGYYYQTVPYWQPKPGAIPPPPVPSQWHTTVGQLPGYGNHPSGIIYGTAPTAVPNSPTPPPWGRRGLPPEPTPASSLQPTQFEPTPTQSPSTPLERSSGSPVLLPIN